MLLCTRIRVHRWRFKHQFLCQIDYRLCVLSLFCAVYIPSIPFRQLTPQITYWSIHSTNTTDQACQSILTPILPPEVCERIIDKIGDVIFKSSAGWSQLRANALSSCALVTRSWLPRARLHLFNGVHLDSHWKTDAFFQALTLTPILGLAYITSRSHQSLTKAPLTSGSTEFCCFFRHWFHTCIQLRSQTCLSFIRVSSLLRPSSLQWNRWSCTPSRRSRLGKSYGLLTGIPI